MRLILATVFSFLFSILSAFSAEKRFTLSAPDDLTSSGFLKHMLPRFSLKTGIRITLSEDATAADFIISDTPESTSRPIFSGLSKTWYASLPNADNTHVKRFLDWLLSDVGTRTITSYAPDGTALFSPPKAQKTVIAEVEISGDKAKGEALSLTHCGRCHVVSAKNRMNAIGSTPSFALLRTFKDWSDRFEAFYALKPHGAFTQIEEVTEPFSDQLPPAIVPVEMTLEDLGAILAYVATIKPADLGAPIRHQ
ncbi:hypothetical protein [Coralliovum pocilloporae]|uniref:hypothetical protein n=1 Tax=Coralliovum pocilloporae TaxID=3066369 RepID=UPI003306D59D